MSSPAADPVLVERSAHVLVVTLNRPEARNAFNSPCTVSGRRAFPASEVDAATRTRTRDHRTSSPPQASHEILAPIANGDAIEGTMDFAEKREPPGRALEPQPPAFARCAPPLTHARANAGGRGPRLGHSPEVKIRSFGQLRADRSSRLATLPP